MSKGSLDIAQVSADVLVRKALEIADRNLHVEVLLQGRKVSFSSEFMTQHTYSRDTSVVVCDLQGCTIADYCFAQNERGDYYHLDDPDETFDFEELVGRIVQVSEDNDDDIARLARVLDEPCGWRTFVGAGDPCTLAATARKFVWAYAKGDTDADKHYHLLCATHAREAMKA